LIRAEASFGEKEQFCGKLGKTENVIPFKELIYHSQESTCHFLSPFQFRLRNKKNFFDVFCLTDGHGMPDVTRKMHQKMRQNGRFPLKNNNVAQD
jgi:hypothetical protein